MIGAIKKQYQKYIETKKSSSEGFSAASNLNFIYMIIMIVTFFVAIYLSIKCHKGINVIDFLIAFCCSPCYVLYRIALGCNNQ